VDAVYKGAVHEEHGVVSPDSGASYGLELSGDGPVVVFATRSADTGVGPFTTLGDDQYAGVPRWRHRKGGRRRRGGARRAERTLGRSAAHPPAAGAAGAELSPSRSTLLVPGLLAAGGLALIVAAALIPRLRRRAP
jgi:hypothetical protein